MNTIPSVVIDEDGGHKYIVVELTADNGEKKLIIRANQSHKYHKNILAWFRETELSGKNITNRCIGGGKIRIHPDTKEIYLSDYSGDFGKEPDRKLTAEILEEAFPGFTVSI